MRNDNPTFRDRVQSGDLLAGMFTQLPSEQMMEIAGIAGFDFSIIDLEHGHLTIDHAERLVRAAECVGVSPLIRVPSGRGDLIAKALDVGAQGLLFPLVNDADDAREAVAAATMAPEGRRGCCPECRSGRYFFDGLLDYKRSTDAAVKIVQIETPRSLDNLDEIVAVPGVDGVLLGPGDLSYALGIAMDDPVIADARDRVFETASRAGIFSMHVLFSPDEVQTWAERGGTVFSYSIDNIIYGQACRSLISEIKAPAGRV